MIQVQFPAGYRLEFIRREHPRKQFSSGEQKVDDWLRTKALQNQDKHLASTKVLLDDAGTIAGFFTLAMGFVDFGELPGELQKGLPHRLLPVAVLAWMGVSASHQGQGNGRRLLAQAFSDCLVAHHTLPFIAILLDALSEQSRYFYQHWGFRELPNDPNRLYLRVEKVLQLMNTP